jgi:hypothetical protein
MHIAAAEELEQRLMPLAESDRDSDPARAWESDESGFPA